MKKLLFLLFALLLGFTEIIPAKAAVLYSDTYGKKDYSQTPSNNFNNYYGYSLPTDDAFRWYNFDESNKKVVLNIYNSSGKVIAKCEYRFCVASESKSFQTKTVFIYGKMSSESQYNNSKKKYEWGVFDENCLKFSGYFGKGEILNSIPQKSSESVNDTTTFNIGLTATPIGNEKSASFSVGYGYSSSIKVNALNTKNYSDSKAVDVRYAFTHFSGAFFGNINARRAINKENVNTTDIKYAFSYRDQDNYWKEYLCPSLSASVVLARDKNTHENWNGAVSDLTNEVYSGSVSPELHLIEFGWD